MWNAAKIFVRQSAMLEWSTKCVFVLIQYIHTWGSRDGAVGIVTRYELEGPGIESRWGEIFRTYPDRRRGPPSLLYNGYWVLPGGKAAGA